MPDFLRNLLSPYVQPQSSTQVPTSLADISGFDLGQPTTQAPTITGGPMSSMLGATLQPGALQSLVTAASQFGLRPGYQELGMFGPQSTYRTWEQQAALYKNKPGVAAPPGSSLHQQGLAIDLPAALQTQKFFDILRALGWFQLRGEPWHWSYGQYG